MSARPGALTGPDGEDGAAGAAGPPSAAGRWRALSPWTRRLVVLAWALLGVNAGLAGLEAVTGGGDPSGPDASSYATAPRGLAAFAQLLEDQGHPVRRLRAPLDELELDPEATLVVAGARDLRAAEAGAVARFVEAGGRLIVAGDAPGPALRALAGGADWSPTSASPARPLAPVPEVSGVGTVAAAGTGSWSDAGASLPVLAGDDAILATVSTQGRGRVVALADASVWDNRRLAEADNAAFGLAAAGEGGRPVDFAEAHHGYGQARGLAAVPWRWRWALGGGLVAVLVAMWSRGRRLGPPEDAERDLPPPRRAYVDALAASLVRTRRPAESLAPLQAAARRRVAERAGLAPDAGDEEVRRAAAAIGLSAADVDALLRPVRSDDDVVAAGRALAGVERAGR